MCDLITACFGTPTRTCNFFVAIDLGPHGDLPVETVVCEVCARGMTVAELAHTVVGRRIMGGVERGRGLARALREREERRRDLEWQAKRLPPKEPPKAG